MPDADPWTLPSRAQVLSYLEDLIAGRRSREEVADWAATFFGQEYLGSLVPDDAALEAVNTLAAADLQTSPMEYLYGPEDFEDWRIELLKSP
jgi:hypothetical protein